MMKALPRENLLATQGFSFTLNVMKFRYSDLATSALALFCAVWLSGGQWSLLQVTAWSGMIVTRTVESGVKDALASTFDGEHPCPLCKVITHAQQEKEDQPAPVNSAGKLKIEANLTSATVVQRRSHLIEEQSWREPLQSLASCDLEPPIPPPRECV
jgi:hypothetical protein